MDFMAREGLYVFPCYVLFVYILSTFTIYYYYYYLARKLILIRSEMFQNTSTLQHCVR